MILLSPYMTTGKTIALTKQTFVNNVMFLLFNIQSRVIIVFLPRRKRLLISWLQSSSAVILEPKKMKSVTVSIVSPSICHGVDGDRTACHDLSFLNVEFLSQLLLSPLSPSSRGSLVLGGVLCLSEVIDIFPSNLDSSL